MKDYSVKELIETLKEKIANLGIDAKFLENPAYGSVAAEIESMILTTNVDSNRVFVQTTQKALTFEWTSQFGNQYSIGIFCSNPETFTCCKVEEKKITVGNQYVSQKEAREIIANLRPSGEIDLTINSASVDNYNCKERTCNHAANIEKREYTVDGVMSRREYKILEKQVLGISIDQLTIDSILKNPRLASANLMDKYEAKTKLIREKLDTARFMYEDLINGVKYNATIPLNQVNGLKDMILPSSNPYLEEVQINPLTPNEIEAMLQRENNKKVAEGLKKYAEGRESYFYTSNDDANFVREGFNESRGLK